MFRTIGILVALTICGTAPAHALQLYTEQINMVVGVTTSTEVSNNENHKVSYRIEIRAEEHAPSIAVLGKDFKRCEGSVGVRPDLFELEPGQYQKIKFTAREIGRCRAFIIPNILQENVVPDPAGFVAPPGTFKIDQPFIQAIPIAVR